MTLEEGAPRLSLLDGDRPLLLDPGLSRPGRRMGSARDLSSPTAFRSGTSGDSSVPFVLWADRWAKSRSRDLRGRILRHVPLPIRFVSCTSCCGLWSTGSLGTFPPPGASPASLPSITGTSSSTPSWSEVGIAYDLEREARARELRAYAARGPSRGGPPRDSEGAAPPSLSLQHPERDLRLRREGPESRRAA